MAATNMPKAELAKLVEKYEGVIIANKNSPSQNVLAGEIDQLNDIGRDIKEASFNFKMLKVSTAFHTKAMKPAYDRFKKATEKVNWRVTDTAVYSNYTGEAYAKGNYSDNLALQISNPVLFMDNVLNAYKNGTRLFIEIGSGKTISDIVKQCIDDNSVKVLSFAGTSGSLSVESFYSTVAQLKVMGIHLNVEMIRSEILPDEITDPHAIELSGIQYKSPETKIRAEKSLEEPSLEIKKAINKKVRVEDKMEAIKGESNNIKRDVSVKKKEPRKVAAVATTV